MCHLFCVNGRVNIVANVSICNIAQQLNGFFLSGNYSLMSSFKYLLDKIRINLGRESQMKIVQNKLVCGHMHVCGIYSIILIDMRRLSPFWVLTFSWFGSWSVRKQDEHWSRMHLFSLLCDLVCLFLPPPNG